MKESKPVYGVKAEKNAYVTMRDGVRVAVDIYRPNAEGTFPALLSMSPYSKDVQVLKIPYGYGFNMEYPHVEAGDTEFWVSRGYAHVIADHRGTGMSEGEFCGWFAKEQQEDGYDLVEWIAQQPWCDGNLGMVGISWFAVIQYLVAAQQPPHLKAIAPHDGWGDLYRDTIYHGGIFSMAWPPFLKWEMYLKNPTSASRKMYREPGQLEKMVEEALNTVPINKCAYLVGTLMVPENDPATFDFTLHPLDGPFYWERSAHTKWEKIKVPVFFGSEMHDQPVSMHLPGSFSGWDGVSTPKKLVTRPSVPERPFHEFHDELLRWYDYWLKGIDNGVMEEPPIRIWVRGANENRFGKEWPLKETRWVKFYLSEDSTLKCDAPPDADEAVDSFLYKPQFPIMRNAVPLDPRPGYLCYTTEPLTEELEITGPLALYLYGSISSEDADWIVKLTDVNPDGTQWVLSRGWLKASHRELDDAKSKPWKPYHPHTRSVPVVPGEINEYAIAIQPIANLFKRGHKIKLEIWGCDYPLPEDWPDPMLGYPAFAHLPNPKETRQSVYRTAQYPSHLLVPVIPRRGFVI